MSPHSVLDGVFWMLVLAGLCFYTYQHYVWIQTQTAISWAAFLVVALLVLLIILRAIGPADMQPTYVGL